MKNPTQFSTRAAFRSIIGLSAAAFLATTAQAVDIGASHDTWVREDNADSNRNGNDQMNARTDIDGDDNDVILLRFPTTALTAEALTTSLNLFWQRNDSGTGNSLSLWGLNETHSDETLWDETTVTYNNAPGPVAGRAGSHRRVWSGEQ